MQSINFDDGLKSFMINDNPNKVIRFNPADPNLIKRLKQAESNILKKKSEVECEIDISPDGTAADKTDEAVKYLDEFESLIREQFNFVFNADVYDMVFNGQSPLCMVKSGFLFEAVLNAITPLIQDEVNKYNKESEQRVAKYTARYYK